MNRPANFYEQIQCRSGSLVWWHSPDCFDDLQLVVEGALFDWHIGYEKKSGTTQKYSKILFRRMPRWTISDFEQANKLKNKFKEFLSNQPE